MAIQRINPDDTEIFTLTTNPPRTFFSGSSGVSGTLHVFPRRSIFEKEVHPLSIFTGSFTDRDLDVIRDTIVQNSASNKFNLLGTYLQNVNQQSVSLRKQQTVEIIRFTPSAEFSSNSIRKTVVINNLMPFYRGIYPEAHFAFTNYHTLNFVTASGFPEDTALIYADPNKQYALTGSAFSFDFWINPRYTNSYPGADFKAGTIFHRSSSYALSMVTGSSRDINGFVDGFKLILQLSHSAEIAPSKAVHGTFPSDLIFTSNDNALKRNVWHHVTVRWDKNYNLGSGSFVINGTNAGSFVIPSSSFSDTHAQNCLFLGNFFEGTAVSYFFTTEVSERDGLDQLVADTGQFPPGYLLDHGLNAEVHELKVYSRYLNDDEVDFLDVNGPLSGSDLLHKNLLFYVPPFYTKESPFRQFVGDHGGIIATPFFERDGTTSTPIDVDVSFGGAGHYVNLENFVRDFARGKYARLFNLTASVITGSATVPTSFNTYLYSTGSNLKRLATILPNDNGNFIPNFTFTIPGKDDYAVPGIPFSVTQSFAALHKVDPTQFVSDNGSTSPGFVTLRNLIPFSLFQKSVQEDSGSLVRGLNGVSPENLGDLPSDDGRYTVFQRTGDNSCDQVVFFDISNLYYGMQIEPGTFKIRQTGNPLEMTVVDDGEGNLYRSNTSGSSPDWASVGNIFYNEGVVLLKHPSLYFFGDDHFDVSFKGKQNTHILTFNLFKRPLMAVSSSNPNYLPVSASTDANDTDKRFVYITGINLHDENLNVIAKTALAQPVVARTGDKFLFKVRMDF